MKTRILFGGAIVELSISSATDEIPANPKIGPALLSFLELYRLAHDYGEDEAFERAFEAFLDETLIFLEDRYIEAGASGDLVSDMEEFMNQRYTKDNGDKE